MADNKKSFLLYCDLIYTVKKMPKDKQADLFLHILEYVNDENPETDDLIIQLTFEPIKQQLKRDLGKWSETLVEKSNAGRVGNLKRWHPDLHKELIDKKITIEEAESIAKHRTAIKVSQPVANVAVTDNVNVNVNGNVLDKPNGWQPQPLAYDFEKPAFAEVKQYFQTQNPGGSNYALNLTDATDFYDHYESNGWMVGPNKMRSWQAGVRKWIKNKGQFSNGETKKPVGEHDWEKSLQ